MENNKELLIKDILSMSDIHHNIHINYAKHSRAIENAKLTDKQRESFNTNMFIEGHMLEMFKEDWENWEVNSTNDTGNRNTGKDCELKGKVWTFGRLCATLYWDAYWYEDGLGFHIRHTKEDLEEMGIEELKEIKKDILEFNKAVENLMEEYYEELEYQAKEHKKNCIEDARKEKYMKMIEPYNVNLFELKMKDDQRISRTAKSLIKLLKIA